MHSSVSFLCLFVSSNYCAVRIRLLTEGMVYRTALLDTETIEAEDVQQTYYTVSLCNATGTTVGQSTVPNERSYRTRNCQGRSQKEQKAKLSRVA
jgi:hypothetical protein